MTINKLLGHEQSQNHVDKETTVSIGKHAEEVVRKLLSNKLDTSKAKDVEKRRTIDVTPRSADGLGEIAEIMNNAGIPESREAEFREGVISLAQDFSKAVASERLNDPPKREMRKGEDVIAYIKAEDGLKPWLDAGVLDRPTLRKLCPRAHNSLRYWLQKPGNDLKNEGLKIPTKNETLRDELTPEAVREARRIMMSHHRLSKAGGLQTQPS